MQIQAHESNIKLRFLSFLLLLVWNSSVIPPYGSSLEIILPPTAQFAVIELKLLSMTGKTASFFVRLRTKETDIHTHTRKKKKLPPPFSVWKLDFHQLKVGGIACCDHKMSSASSLSPYQAVCCTEHSPLAPGAGHTSWHPSPPVASLSLSLSLFLGLSLSFFFLPGCSDPPSPPLPSPSPRGARLP